MIAVSASSNEVKRRGSLWNELLSLSSSKCVAPTVLRQLGIYGGAQGIWVNKQVTGHLTTSGKGVTVSLLHKGAAYPDDLLDDGLLYHYPNTARQPGRDRAEIDATKAAGELQMPIFAITATLSNPTCRDVSLAWVDDWDDQDQRFLIRFDSEQPSKSLGLLLEDVAPFVMVVDEEFGKSLSRSRMGQNRFKLRVFQRYGSACAVCGINIIELLDAAHIFPKHKGGSDDPRNGLVLCALHHRAFDSGLFAIDPHTLEVCCKPEGPNVESLRLTFLSLAHLQHKPHIDAFKWRWDNITGF